MYRQIVPILFFLLATLPVTFNACDRHQLNFNHERESGGSTSGNPMVRLSLASVSFQDESNSIDMCLTRIDLHKTQGGATIQIPCGTSSNRYEGRKPRNYRAIDSSR